MPPPVMKLSSVHTSIRIPIDSGPEGYRGEENMMERGGGVGRGAGVM